MAIDATRLQVSVQEQERWRRKMSVTVPAAVVREEEQRTARHLASLFAPAIEYGYVGHIVKRSVSVAELKNNLSAYLARVRAGEEVLVRDRRTPIAKIVPLSSGDEGAEALALAAEGLVRLPEEQPPRSFWRDRGPRVAGNRALEVLREQRDDR